MSIGGKTLTGAGFVLGCALVLTTPAWAISTHPDGAATTYRGWGPSVPTADGYACTIYDALGVRVGSVQFHADGRIDVTLGTEQAHFVTNPVGFADIHDLDTATFPDIPKQFQSKGGYRLMVFTGRFQVGVNTAVGTPETELADRISAVEARCVYIIDSAGNVVFCLNCTFTIS
jgi:hypothetical protein